MSKTRAEAEELFRGARPKLEHDIDLVAERAIDRTDVVGKLEVRAVHVFSLYSNGKPVAPLCGNKKVKMSNLELRGLVTSMNGSYRYPAMAGEWYIPMMQFETASIRDEEFYRGGYICIQPDEWYESLYSTMFKSHLAAAVKAGEISEDVAALAPFEDVQWDLARPGWWKDLASWLQFKTWYRKFAGISKGYNKDDKSGDDFRANDEQYEEDEEDEDYIPGSDTLSDDSLEHHIHSSDVEEYGEDGTDHSLADPGVPDEGRGPNPDEDLSRSHAPQSQPTAPGQPTPTQESQPSSIVAPNPADSPNQPTASEEQVSPQNDHQSKRPAPDTQEEGASETELRMAKKQRAGSAQDSVPTPSQPTIPDTTVLTSECSGTTDTNLESTPRQEIRLPPISSFDTVPPAIQTTTNTLSKIPSSSSLNNSSIDHPQHATHINFDPVYSNSEPAPDHNQTN
ncbi:hypothetical protein FRC07_009573, partial [Ceratobasidium sp. 392]